MSRIQVWAWKCDRPGCDKIWYTGDEVTPKACAKCKARNWNRVVVAGVDLGVEKPEKILKTKPESRAERMRRAPVVRGGPKAEVGEGSSAARASVSKTEDDGSSPSRPAIYERHKFQGAIPKGGKK